MRVKQITTAVAACALATYAFTSQANNGDTGHVWMPKQPTSKYWDAPTWTPQSAAPARQEQRRPQYRPPNRANNFPPPDMNRPNMNRPDIKRPGANRPPVNRKAPPPVANTNRTPPPPSGPYRGAPAPRRPGSIPNEPSAFNTPGYRPNYNNRGSRMPWGGNRGGSSMPWSNNRGGNNKFWGRSGPSTWMSPGKRNWENSWDDMINAPSRMGEMPGGWTAPEVTVPNPIDMGDQMQDNVKDLPDQMKNMDVGNEVND